MARLSKFSLFDFPPYIVRAHQRWLNDGLWNTLGRMWDIPELIDHPLAYYIDQEKKKEDLEEEEEMSG